VAAVDSELRPTLRAPPTSLPINRHPTAIGGIASLGDSLRFVKLRRAIWLVVFVLGGVALVIFGDFPVGRTLVTLAFIAIAFRFGFGLIGSFARPVPAPPPPGELRRVRLKFRCTICSTEVRMTAANDEVPEPPRHCLEDMELVAPLYD